MKNIALVTIMALLCIAPSGAQSVKQTVVNVSVVNLSATCAWVTIYWGRPHTAWHIEAETPQSRPQFVHKGKYNVFPVIFRNTTPIPLPMEVKVRAEFQRNADCSGGTIADHSAQRKGIAVDRGLVQIVKVSSELSGPPYGVTAPR